MRCWQKFPGSTLAAKWFWATRNWQVTEDRWQKTWFTCHSKNQPKQCKRIELRRWQSLRGSTLAFRSTWSSKKTCLSKSVNLLALSTCWFKLLALSIVQIKPFSAPSKGKIVLREASHGAWSHTSHCWAFSSWHAGAQENSNNADACQWLEHGKKMLMHDNDFNMDRWQMTTARPWIVLQYLASRSSFNDINELQTSRASTSASSTSFKFKLQTSRCLKHEAHEANVHCLFQDLSLMPSCDHHVSTMWSACYHPMPPMASYGPLLWAEPEKHLTTKANSKITLENHDLTWNHWNHDLRSEHDRSFPWRTEVVVTSSGPSKWQC